MPAGLGAGPTSLNMFPAPKSNWLVLILGSLGDPATQSNIRAPHRALGTRETKHNEGWRGTASNGPELSYELFKSPLSHRVTEGEHDQVV